MKLDLRKSFKFSQGNIRESIGAGWCAGLTSAASAKIDKINFDEGMSTRKWLDACFVKLKLFLEEITQNKSSIATLQSMFEKVKNKEDISSNIHEESYERRCCKILITVTRWTPVLGHCMKEYQNSVVNHVGLIVRSGKDLLIFEPNFGVGLFSIADEKPLSLDELSKAIAKLTTLIQYLSCNATAQGVIDEDALRLRPTVAEEKRNDEFLDLVKGMNFGPKKTVAVGTPVT